MYRLQGQVSLLDYLMDGRFEWRSLGPLLMEPNKATGPTDYMPRDSGTEDTFDA